MNCPKCAGSGKVTIDAPGIARMRTDCPICDGAGKVKLDPGGMKVNPATILPTGGRGHFDDDPLSQRVDWIVCAVLTEDQHDVIMLTYTINGSQSQKARRMNPPISQQFFSVLLGEAHAVIMRELDIN